MSQHFAYGELKGEKKASRTTAPGGSLSYDVMIDEKGCTIVVNVTTP